MLGLLALALAGCTGGAETLQPLTVASPLAYPPPRYEAPFAPPPRATAAQAVLAYAAAQVGRPYCWGGTGPGCFDCSGLTMMAWRQAGVKLPRTADDVALKLHPVPLTQAQPGDILWWPGHVGIYAGNGWSIEALDKRSGVVYRRAPAPHRVLRPG